MIHIWICVHILLEVKDFSCNAGNQTLPQRPWNYSSLLLSMTGGVIRLHLLASTWAETWRSTEQKAADPDGTTVLCGQKPELWVSLAIMKADFCWDSEQHGLLLATESSRLTMTSKHLSNWVLSNMDGPRDCHPEGSKSERGEILHDIPYMRSVERKATNEFTDKTETDLENKLMVAREEGCGKG